MRQQQRQRALLLSPLMVLRLLPPVA